nr:hypothetical protein [uncultured Schaedlerella sp.]
MEDIIQITSSTGEHTLPSEIDAAKIGLPTSGVMITSAGLIPADAADNPNIEPSRIMRVDIEKLKAFIAGVPYLSSLQREFYQTYIEARLEKIFLPAYKKTLLITLRHAKELENFQFFFSIPHIIFPLSHISAIEFVHGN